MKIDREYKVSAFGDFSDIVPTPDNMMLLLQEFKDFGMVPSIFQEIQIDTNGAQPISVQRLALVSNDGLEQVPIGSNRIDFIHRTATDISLQNDEITGINNRAVSIFDYIFRMFDKKASRLALNTESMIVDISEAEIDSFLAQFSNPIHLYPSSALDEWNTRLMVRKEATIDGKQEVLNVITIINKQKFNKNVDGQQKEFDGFSVNVDINTLFERSIQRFRKEDCESFIAIAAGLWKEIIEEVG